MVQDALAYPEALSVLPCSLCIRFRLLLLALEILHCRNHTSPLAVSKTSEAILRERIYRTALAWFCCEPM